MKRLVAVLRSLGFRIFVIVVSIVHTRIFRGHAHLLRLLVAESLAQVLAHVLMAGEDLRFLFQKIRIMLHKNLIDLFLICCDFRR